MSWCQRVESRSTGMYNICDICCLLITCYLDQEAARVIFVVLYIERNCMKSLEQFLAYMVNAHFEHFLLVEEFSGRSNFQNATLIDDSYSITNSFYIGQ